MFSTPMVAMKRLSISNLQDSRGKQSSAVLNYLLGVLFCLTLVLILAQSTSARSTKIISQSEMQVRGNLLPIKLLNKKHKGKISRSLDILEFITTSLPGGFSKDLNLETSSINKKGFQGEKFHVFAFEEHTQTIKASNDLLKFLNASPNSGPGKYSGFYQTSVIDRSGIEFGMDLPDLLDIQSALTLRYWEINRYQRMLFIGEGTTDGDYNNLTGTLSNWDQYLNAFREDPFYGHGVSLSLSFSKAISDNTILFVEDMPLFSKDLLYNIGVLTGFLETNQEYIDSDGYLNYAPLISGRYKYGNVAFPAGNNLTFGAEHRLNANTKVQLSSNGSFQPTLQVKHSLRKFKLQESYTYPSLYYFEVGHGNVSAGVYLGKAKDVGLTSVGVKLEGGFEF
ncbi:MAG: hypothetical protein GX992_09920 [Clostridium sp.]|nr:hypothetical protein [Clostridium sp.]